MIYNYLPLERVYHGVDSTKKLPELLRELKARKALVITSKSVSRTKFYSKLLKRIPIPYSEFIEVSQHSPMEEIEHATEMFRNHQCDVIISIGGGSVNDAAKVVRYYYDINTKHIAIPTTLSAAEFSHIAGYTIGGEKAGIRDKAITPSYVFIEPRAAMETPKVLWRSSGIRALDHAIETAVSNSGSEIARHFSVLAIKKLLNNLQFDSIEARYECLLGAWYSYFEVYDAPMGLSHNIGKIIGAKWEIPHGITSCITLPEVMKMYAHDSSGILCNLASQLGFSVGSPEESAMAFAKHVENFIHSLGLSKRLTDYGITEQDLDYILSKLKGDPEKIQGLLTSMF